MQITDLRWKNGEGYDVHVLRGSLSRRLDQILEVEFINDSGVRVTATADALPPGIDVTFLAQYASAPTAHGVDVSLTTGQVTANLVTPAGPALRNFLIRAEANSTETPDPVSAWIRIHIHEALASLWLTPTSLTIRANAQGVRLSVLAAFQDRTIGDITNWSTLTWTSSDPASISVDPSTGVLSTSTSGILATITVSHGPLPPPPHATSTANVRSEVAWTAQRQVTWIAGRGRSDWQEVPNLLFLGDGFQESERGEFNRIVRSAARSLRSWYTTRPFDLLSNSLNIWSAFVRSEDSAVRFLPECYVVGRRGSAKAGVLVPLPRQPDPAASTWTLAQLVHTAGLPVPIDDDPATATPLADKVVRWQALYGSHVQASKIPENVYRAWLALSDRRLIDEVDTAFGFAHGNRPNLEQFGNLTFPPRRMRREEFFQFLESLHLGTQHIGTTWTTGKDAGLVCVILRSEFSAGQNFFDEGGGYFMASLGKTYQIQLEERSEPSDLRVSVNARQIPTRVPLPVLATIAHEAAHSFDLGDEYGGTPAQVDATLAITDGNLQLEADLHPTPTSGLIATLVNWALWPRIEKAGVLRSSPTTTIGELVIELAPRHGKPFRRGDIAKLRKRPLLVGNNSVPSQQLEILDDAIGDLVRARLIPDAFHPPGDFDPAEFPGSNEVGPAEASILFVPLRTAATETDPLGVDLPLMAEIIRNHMTNTGAPLYANPGHAAMPPTCIVDPSRFQEPDNLPNGMRPVTFEPWIIGLYEGGARFECGIFHPAGACLMRKTDIDLDPGVRSQDRALTLRQQSHRTFCHVCRYVLVDRLDPRQHGEIDKDYWKMYPQL